MIANFARQVWSNLPSFKGLRTKAFALGHPFVLTSLVVTGLVLGVRQLKGLQSLELAAYDRMVQFQPTMGPDPRLLIVTITESDIKAQQRWPLSDQTITQVLAELERHQPRVIGLDLHRDVPQEPGRAALLKQLQAPNIIAITTIGENEDSSIAPPPGMPWLQIGFNDIVTDLDGVIRRNFLFGDTGTTDYHSFALRLAAHYLAQDGIVPQASWKSYGPVPWGKAVFTPLQPNSGSYQGEDAAGYQLLLGYRPEPSVARQVSLTQVVNGKVDPSWVRDKVVLIGTTAPSIKDAFFTPYSATEQGNPKMPGVFIHGHMVSQVLGAVLGDRPLFWFWPQWGEAVWIFGWSCVGGLLAWRVRHPLALGAATICSIGGIVAIGYGLFLQAGWIPVVPPILSFSLSVAGMITYYAYQTEQDRLAIARQAQEQEKTIALLKTVLTEPSLPPQDMTRTLTQSTQANYTTQKLTESTHLEQQTELLDQGGGTIAELQDAPLGDRNHFLLGKRYKIDRVLGSGGFSVTYLAEDTQRPGNPLCVVKHLVPARNDVRFLQTAKRLFKTEAEILEKLGRHDQIPQLLAAFEENAEFYLVEEFIEGHPLSDELRAGQQYSEPEVVELLKSILDVLVFIHERHVIHRDLKPSNIIRRQHDHQLVLIDFGAVKQMQPQDYAQEEGFTVAIGTRGYAAPEQLAGYPSLSSDIYALGMIGIQALTGKFPSQLQPNMESGTLMWRHLRPIQAELANILDKMICYYFNERYQSAIEVLRDLKPLLHAYSVAARNVAGSEGPTG